MIFHFASFVSYGRCCCWTDFIWTTNKKRISVETLLPPSFAHTHSMHIGCTSPFYFVVVLCTIALHNSCVSVCVCFVDNSDSQKKHSFFPLCQSISVCRLVFAASNRSFFTLSLSPCVWDSLWIDNADHTIDLFTSDLFRCFAGWFFTFSFKCVRVNLV